MTEDELISTTKELLKCDTARISRPMEAYFLIIGFTKHTKDDKFNRWEKNGDPYEFEYVEEKCVAMGKDIDGLYASLKEYIRLSTLTMEDYMLELEKLKKQSLDKI